MTVRLRLRVLVPLLVAAAIAVTWPLAVHLANGVTDFGDPLLNSWILAWDAHALATSPRHLFDANIFYPESWTLAYSETLLLPGVLLAPVIWAGGSGILAHNLTVLSAYVLSGLWAFLLVRRLTRDDGAAFVSAVIFAALPYRMEALPKVQLQLSWLWPLALLAMLDVFEKPGWRSAGAFALAAGAEMYACVYYGIFEAFGVGAVALVGLLYVRQNRGRTTAWLAAGAVGAVLVALPLALAYRQASHIVGERGFAEVRQYSATVANYAEAHPESWLYRDEHRLGEAERHLFPGYVAPALAVASLIPPMAPGVVAYMAAGFVTFDLSLGANAPGYAWLYRHVPPLRALRVPARLGMFVGFVLSVLAGFGVARVSRGRTQTTRILIVCAAALGAVAEGRVRTQTLVELEPRPSVYRWLAEQPDGVVCEYPVGNLEGRAGPQDPTYMYYSTMHWKPLVNGYSGFAPPSYRELLTMLDGFPDDRAIAYLRTRHVRYLLVHQPFYIEGHYADDVAALKARSDLRWAGRFRWRTGETSDAFLLIP